MKENFQGQNLEEDLDLKEIVQAQEAEKRESQKEEHEFSAVEKRLKTMDQKERKFLTVFFVVGLGIIILGLLQFFGNVNLSIEEILRTVPPEEKYLSAGEKEQLLKGLNGESDDEELKKLDTDHDGLSDWDEVNIYGTSPYLEDSDSDGFADKVEITTGQNPNCPEGKTCFASGESEAPETIAVNGSAPDTGMLSSLDQRLLSGEFSSEELRGFLLDLGISQDIIDSVSDENLMYLYQQAITNNPMNEEGTFDITAIPEDDMQKIKNMDAATIRKLLVDSGADESMLNSFTDDEIRALFLQTIEEIKQ